MNIKYPQADPHALSMEELLLAFQTDAAFGNGETEAENRARKFGIHAYQSQRQKSIFMMVLLPFKSPMVYLLLVAVAATFYFQNTVEAIAIMVVILVNALIGFLMELQARNSMNALKEMDVAVSKVLRDGKIKEVPSEKIVPGDIIMLEPGDEIPGYADLLKCNQLQCDESLLTGKSLPSEKSTEKFPNATALGDQATAVTNSNGKAVVTGIARHTQLGTFSSLADSTQENRRSHGIYSHFSTLIYLIVRYISCRKCDFVVKTPSIMIY